MKPIQKLPSVIAFLLLTASVAGATPIFDVSGSLTLADPVQLGRLSRNGIPQDWSGTETFPGVLNTTTTYHYHTYTVNVDSTPFIQIDFDSLSANTFVSAYDTAYVPNSGPLPNLGFNTNWLGDAGFSGNPFPGDPLFFQVLVPLNHNLVIVVKNPGASNVGVGDPFHLTVEGFVDSACTASSIPEPATLVLTGGGLGLVALRRRRRGTPESIPRE